MSEQADTIEPVAEATPAEADGWSWAVLEVFGHRRHSGRVREEERFGAKMLRIDVPNQGDPAANGWTTHLYTAGAIFSLSYTDEATALKANKPYESPHRLTYRDVTEEIDANDDDRPF